MATVDPVSVDNRFRRGRVCGGSTKGWSIRQHISERISIVGCEMK